MQDNYQRIDDRYNDIAKKLQHSNHTALNAEEKQLFSAIMFHEEIFNGGLLSWLTNINSNYAQDVKLAMKACNMLERLAILNKTASLFSAEKIPEDLHKRLQEISMWPDRKLQELEELDNNYYNIGNSRFYDELAVSFLD